MLSKVVNAAISTPLLYEGIMKPLARRTVINKAEKNGVPWRANALVLEASPQVYELYEQIKDTTLAESYPDYYLKPFHAYSEGNLCWQAAFEAESATYAMGLRVWAKENLTWKAAQDRVRDTFLDCVEEHISENQLTPPATILDAGCSVGISTRAIHERFPQAQMTGMDLSPNMLAVAAYRDNTEKGRPEEEALKQRRTWVHGIAEGTCLPDEDLDLYVLAYVVHELPRQAIQDVVKEAARVLKPGGVLAITDNDPQSAVIQGLPPFVFTLMKSTEPHSDEYYTLNMEETLRASGFKDVHTEASNPRHRTVLGTRC